MNRITLLLIAIIILTSLSGLGLYTYNENQRIYAQAQERKKIERAIQLEAEEKRNGIKKAFDLSLQQFLDNIKTKAKAYKNKRTIIKDMLKSENLRDPDFITQNNALAQTIIPEMQQDMDEFMAYFTKADQKVRALIHDATEEDQILYTQKWNALKSEYSELYTAYFLIETEMLSTSEALLNLYTQNKNQIVVDVVSNTIALQNKQSEDRHLQLKESLKQLNQDQSNLFKAYLSGQ